MAPTSFKLDNLGTDRRNRFLRIDIVFILSMSKSMPGPRHMSQFEREKWAKVGVDTVKLVDLGTEWKDRALL